MAAREPVSMFTRFLFSCVSRDLTPLFPSYPANICRLPAGSCDLDAPRHPFTFVPARRASNDQPPDVNWKWKLLRNRWHISVLLNPERARNTRINIPVIYEENMNGGAAVLLSFCSSVGSETAADLHACQCPDLRYIVLPRRGGGPRRAARRG